MDLTQNMSALRLLMMMGFIFQFFLIICGNKRKCCRGPLFSLIVGLIYILSDWLANISFGVMVESEGDNGNLQSHSQSQTKDEERVFDVLWAPIVLLHLGGPDTITASSLEDNNQWGRQLLEFAVQLAVVLEIFVSMWTNTALTYLAIPISLSGVIKYLQPILGHIIASTEKFVGSSESSPALPRDSDLEHYGDLLKLKSLHRAYSLFPLLKRLYANQSPQIQSYDQRITRADSSGQAFEIVDIQLGFLYDVLYTKAAVVYSVGGIISRLFTFLSTLSALILFFIFIQNHDEYSTIDIIETTVLLIGAVIVETYTSISLFFTDWTIRWLTEKRSCWREHLYSAITCRCSPCCKRWSESIAQLNLVSLFEKKIARKCIGIDFLFSFYLQLQLCWPSAWAEVDATLKRFIFDYLKDISARNRDDTLQSLLAYRGNFVLQEQGNALPDHIRENIINQSLDFSLLVWHLATEVCFHSFKAPDQEETDFKVASKKISDYMLYLLLMCPSMLPNCVDSGKYVRDTFSYAPDILGEAIRGGESYDTEINESQITVPLLQQCEEVFPHAHHLAQHLGSVRVNDNRWKIICGVWIEKLTYAASHCEWKAHAERLPKGGELLTHVCLLMADFGLIQRFD